MKNLISIVFAFLLSSCSFAMSKNKMVTEKYFDIDGNLDRIVTTEELTDDAMYYKQSAESIIESSMNTCAPNCAPGEFGNIEAFRTIRAITGNSFVARGMNGVEGAVEIGKPLVSNGPLAFLAWQFGKIASRPGSVKMDGDGNSYSTTEYHWTGNTGAESSYRGPVTGGGFE